MKRSRPFFILLLLGCLGFFQNLTAQDFWEHMNIPDSSSVVDIMVNSSGDIFLGESKYFSVPDYGGIQRSGDHGATWTPVCPRAYGHGNSLSIDQFGHIYASVSDSIYKSENNGDSWINLGYGGFGHTLECGFDSIVLKGGYDYTAIVRSGDYGATWKEVFTLLEGLWSYVTDFAFASNGMIYASVRISDMSESGVYRSTDLGNTWEPFGLDDYAVMSVAMDNNGNLLAGTMSQGLFRYDMTTQQWTNLLDNTTVNGIIVTQDNKFYLATSDMPTFSNLGGCIVYDDNTGTWCNQNSGLSDHFISDGITVDKDGYLLLWAGGLLFKSTEQVITDVQPQSNAISQNMFFNYPNPFTDHTSIFYDTGNEKTREVEIRVFDMNGKLYFHHSGKTSFPFLLNTEMYPPGLYSVVINDQGKHSRIKIVHL